MAATPTETPTIKPQETLPLKNPMPTDTIEKAANALPALPVTILTVLHISLKKASLAAKASKENIEPKMKRSAGILQSAFNLKIYLGIYC